jgi:hypothetical protein
MPKKFGENTKKTAGNAKARYPFTAANSVEGRCKRSKGIKGTARK